MLKNVIILYFLNYYICIFFLDQKEIDMWRSQQVSKVREKKDSNEENRCYVEILIYHFTDTFQVW